MYVRPGVYIQQKYLVSGVARGGIILPCIVGKGLKNKRIWSEEIVRGRVKVGVAPDDNGVFVLTEPSDMRYTTSRLFRDGQDLGNFSFEYVDATHVRIKPQYFVHTSSYEFWYIAPNRLQDRTDSTVEELVFVAAAPDGTRPYVNGVDFQFVNGEIDWSVVKPASYIGTNPEPYNLSINNRIRISFDGKRPIEVLITGADQSAVTAEEVAAAINAAFGTDTEYGGDYGNVASVVTVGGQNYVELTAVVVGIASLITFYSPSSGDASQTVFGITAPYYVRGEGVRPALGEVYYVSYDTVRPQDEYNKPRLFFSYSDVVRELGPMTIDNDLLLAAEVYYENGGDMLAVVQVEDFDGDGVYTETDWYKALDAVKMNKSITEVIPLTANPNVLAYFVNLIEDEASLLKNHWMGGWCGVDYGTVMGSLEEVGTMVWYAGRLLQVSGTSQGRGRFVLIGVPDKVTLEKDIVLTDTRTTIVRKVGTYFIAPAVVGIMLSQGNVTDILLRKQVLGFRSESVGANEVAADYLAANGVFTIINKGGRLIVFDPVTTDTSGEEVFAEPSIRVQKDLLAYRIRKRLDDIVVGSTPDNLDDFLYELRYHIAAEIEAAIIDKVIGPYIDENTGLVRPLDIMNDIKVFRSPVSKTEYRFVYSFYGRYGVKRIFGEYIIDRAIR